MAILRNPKTGTKLSVPYRSKQYAIMKADGWKDVTPKATEKQLAHRQYWIWLGNIHRLRANLRSISANGLLTPSVRARIYDLEENLTHLLRQIEKEKENGNSNNG